MGSLVIGTQTEGQQVILVQILRQIQDDSALPEMDLSQTVLPQIALYLS